jgi:hypothetical protein
MSTPCKQTSFEKTLSANDTSKTGAHMGGILIPKTEHGLIALFPKLDAKEYNPSIFLNFKAPNGEIHKLRFVYYNNKLHGKGTRNEYRLTYLTKFIRNSNAVPGDNFRLTKTEDGTFEMEIVKKTQSTPSKVIKLRGWNQVC